MFENEQDKAFREKDAKKLARYMLCDMAEELFKNEGYLRRHNRVLPTIGFHRKNLNYALTITFDTFQIQMIPTKEICAKTLCLSGEACYDFNYFQIRFFSYKKAVNAYRKWLLEKV